MKNSKIKALAVTYLKNNPRETVVYTTSDGQLFTSKSAADLHANFNSKKKKLTVSTFGNDDQADGSIKDASQDSPLNAKDLIKQVATVTEATVLDAIEKAENALEAPRKTVLKAIGDKRAELAQDGGQKNDDKRKEDDPSQDDTPTSKDKV